MILIPLSCQVRLSALYSRIIYLIFTLQWNLNSVFHKNAVVVDLREIGSHTFFFLDSQICLNMRRDLPLTEHVV